jgi:predicted short-subunit dehydrogenase-like oxidoreductase (DUF2520 family)
LAFAKALAAAGHEVTAVSASTDEARDRVEAMIPGVAILGVPAVIESAELVILALPTDQIAPTVAGLAEVRAWRAGQLVAHTSGEFGLSVLQPASLQGVIPMAIHPAMTFTGTSIDLERMKECYFAVAAPKVALPIAQALVLEMGGEPIVIEEPDRAAYFEAVSVASSFSAMVVNQAIGLLEGVGVDNARDVLAPVVRSSVEQALAAGHREIEPDEFLEK